MAMESIPTPGCLSHAYSLQTHGPDHHDVHMRVFSGSGDKHELVDCRRCSLFQRSCGMHVQQVLPQVWGAKLLAGAYLCAAPAAF